MALGKRMEETTGSVKSYLVIPPFKAAAGKMEEAVSITQENALEFLANQEEGSVADNSLGTRED